MTRQYTRDAYPIPDLLIHPIHDIEKQPMKRFEKTFVLSIFLVLGIVKLFGSNVAIVGQETRNHFSGPQKGERLPELKVKLVFGEEADKTIDLVKRAAGRPTLLVIVNESNRPAARLTRCLMNFAEMRAEKLFAGVVYLDRDPKAAEQQLKQAVSWWKVAAAVGVSLEGVEGPGGYGFNRHVNVTVLVADKGRVTSNYALVQPSETDAPKILKDVVALAGGRIPTLAEVAFLSAPTAKPADAPWHIAPADVQMRRLICDALAANNSKSAHLAAIAVEEYVGDNKTRQAALNHVAKYLLQRRTREAVVGQPVAKHLRRWGKHGE